MVSIWYQDDLFSERRFKSAAALAAVATTLQRRPSLTGQSEFLELYAFLKNCGSDVVTQVWSEPRAYAWTHRTFDMLKAVLQTPLWATEFSAQLNQFKLFALAAACLTKSDLTFVNGYEPPQRVGFPGTSWCFERNAPVTIWGIERGQLVLEVDGNRQRAALDPDTISQTANWSLFNCPVVRHAGCEIRLQPQALFVPELPETAPATRSTTELQRRHAALLEKSLDLLAAHQPVCFRQMQDWLHVIGFMPVVRGSGNTTMNDLPGGLLLIPHHTACELAESLAHEFHHYLLFLHEDRGPFFVSEESNTAATCKYYSPWREDPRPLKGLLHAAYVFTAVARLWLSMTDGACEEEDLLIRGRQRLSKLGLQLPMVKQVLQEHADFSTWGQQIFGELSCEIEDVSQQIERRDDLYADLPALELRSDGTRQPLTSRINGRPLSIRQEVHEHILLFDKYQQGAKLLGHESMTFEASL